MSMHLRQICKISSIAVGLSVSVSVSLCVSATFLRTGCTLTKIKIVNNDEKFDIGSFSYVLGH